MKARWQALAAKFAALQQREKLLVAATTIFAIGVGGYTFWVEPALLRAATLNKQIAQQQTEIQGLQAQLAGLRTQSRDPDAANKAALAEVKARIAASETALHQYDTTLVPPARMPQLLQSLLSRHHGLELVSLQTLTPSPLLTPPAVKPDAAKPDAGAKGAPPPAPRGGNIHKHGLEIKVAGSYPDLLTYLEDLERLPQKLIWGRMALVVTNHPRCEMTLTVYTLSLDSTWLVV